MMPQLSRVFSVVRRPWSLTVASLFMLAACGGGDPGSTGLASLVSVSAAASDQCPNGGSQVNVGLDKNRNKTLDTDEVTSSWPVCQGSAGVTGTNGANSMILSEPTPPDDVCPYGGVLITMGIDANGNGVLDAEEISAAPAPQQLCSAETAEFSGLVFLAPMHFSSSLELYRVSADGSGLLKLAATSDATRTIERMRVSPDRRWVAFAAAMNSNSPRELYVASLVDSRPVVKVSGPVDSSKQGIYISSFPSSTLPEMLWWSPDSSRIAYVADTDASDDVELYTVSPEGTGRVRIDAIGPNPYETIDHVAWSADSAWLAYCTESRLVIDAYYPELYVTSVNGSVSTKIDPSIFGATSFPTCDFSWSPQGATTTRIAFLTVGTTAQASALYVTQPTVMADSAQLVAESTTSMYMAPAWEPLTGSYLAFVSQEAGDTSATLRFVDAVSFAKTTVTVSGSASQFAWAPSGAAIAYLVNESDGSVTLWTASPVAAASTVAATRASPAFAADALVRSISWFSWAPNSTRVAYTVPHATALQGQDLHTVAANGSGHVLIRAAVKVGGGYREPFFARPAWSPDGTRMAYLSGATDQSYATGLHVASPTDASGGLQVSTAITAEFANLSAFKWSADGSQLAYAADVDGDGLGVATLFVAQAANAASATAILPVSQAGPLRLSSYAAEDVFFW